MIAILYDFPLPNNGDRYDLSQEELQELLDKAYWKGYKQAEENSGITYGKDILRNTTWASDWY